MMFKSPHATRFVAMALTVSLLSSLSGVSVLTAMADVSNPYGYASTSGTAAYGTGYGSTTTAVTTPSTTTTTSPTSYSYSYPSTGYSNTASTTTTPAATTNNSIYAYPSYPATNTAYTYGTTGATGYANGSTGTYGYDTLKAGITTIPKGTVLLTRMDGAISSYSARIGDPISGTVESDIYSGSDIVVPAGSAVLGNVSGVTNAGFVGRPGSLEMQFTQIRRPDGTMIPIKAHIVTQDNTGIMKGGTTQSRILNTAGVAALGAGSGTLVGLAAGSLLKAAGRGAVFGLAVGTIAGVGYGLVKKGPQVSIPSGARISIMVDQSSGG